LFAQNLGNVDNTELKLDFSPENDTLNKPLLFGFSLAFQRVGMTGRRW